MMAVRQVYSLLGLKGIANATDCRNSETGSAWGRAETSVPSLFFRFIRAEYDENLSRA
jgi:hypothetical protein